MANSRHVPPRPGSGAHQATARWPDERAARMREAAWRQPPSLPGSVPELRPSGPVRARGRPELREPPLWTWPPGELGGPTPDPGVKYRRRPGPSSDPAGSPSVRPAAGRRPSGRPAQPPRAHIQREPDFPSMPQPLSSLHQQLPSNAPPFTHQAISPSSTSQTTPSEPSPSPINQPNPLGSTPLAPRCALAGYVTRRGP